MRLFSAVLLWMTLLAAISPAQVAEVSVSGRRSQIGGNELGSFGFAQQPVRLNSGFGLAARLDLYTGEFLAHELSYGFDRDSLELSGEDLGAVTVHQFFYDLMLHLTPRGAPVRPFIVGGLGFSGFFPPDTDILQTGGLTKFGFNYGGGLKFRLSDRFGLRVDIRDHVSSKPNLLNLADVTGQLHQVEYSAGLSLYF